jgi:hypothetical protein
MPQRISSVLFAPKPLTIVDEFGSPLDEHISAKHMSSESVTNIPSRARCFPYGTNAVRAPKSRVPQMVLDTLLYAGGIAVIFLVTLILGGAH